MKFITAIFFTLLMHLAGHAQQSIRGRVVAAGTGLPIPGCSVFITNTSIGTTTDAAGNFELAGLPPGKNELVISSIGYTTNVYPFTEAQLPLTVKVELAIRAKEMTNVTLEPSVEEGWDKWGKMFMDNFVGTTDNAAYCSIKNTGAVRFRYYKKSNRLIAYCDEPVLLENKALGYDVSYQLENFEVNFKEGSVSYLGYSFFTPHEPGSRTKQYKLEQNRKLAYQGSVLHFMRSVYNNRLQEEGFDVFRMRRVPNAEKQRVNQVYKTHRQVITTNSGNMTAVQAPENEIELEKDTLAYYSKVMRQPDYFEVYDSARITTDSLLAIVSGEIKSISFDNYLFITFRNEKEEPGYVKIQFPARKAGLQRSYVFLGGDQLIAIDMNGNYNDPRDFITFGYWGWGEKMANSLPLDYDPDQ